MPVSIDEFRMGMRYLPAGVCLVTTGAAPNRHGLTATAMMSLTAEPPQLVVALNRNTAAHPAMLERRAFAVNLLSVTHVGLAETFAGRTGRKGDDRFLGIEWTQLATGSPILEAAVASFDCTLAGEFAVSTHSLFVGAIEALQVNPTALPLLHRDGDWVGITPPRAVREHTLIDWWG